MIANNQSVALDRLLDKAADGRRLSVDEALQLAGEAALADLGLAADARRNQLHPGHRVSYIVERNINYTNVCNVYCRFCAFYRGPGRPAVTRSAEKNWPPRWTNCSRLAASRFCSRAASTPNWASSTTKTSSAGSNKIIRTVNLHALSADEVLHVCKVSSLSIGEALTRLIAAGMGSLPGAGRKSSSIASASGSRG